MSTETQNTASTAQAASASAPPADNQATQTGSDSTGNTGFQHRIDGLTAQLGRKDEKIAEMEKRLNELAEANKSEQQKLIDAAADERLEQFKKQEYEPLTTKAEQMSAALSKQIELHKAQLPEEKRGLFESLPLVEQLNAYQTLTAELTGSQTVSVGGTANPPEQRAKERIAGSEFRQWQNLNKNDAEQLELYDKYKAEMQAAYRDKRIDWER